MSEQQTGTSVANIAGVVIDLAKVPSHDGPKGSHLRSTGRGYVADDGTPVAHAEIIVGPHPEASTDQP